MTPAADRPGEGAWRLPLRGEAATAALAAEIAMMLGPGDLVTLTGDLGAGKTTFARDLIRHLTGEPDLDVPSPTFTLVQAYEGGRFPILHADLYRVKSPDELAELGIEDMREDALLVVEWPERAGDALEADRLEIALAHDIPAGPTARIATLTGIGAWAGRLERARQIRALLDEAGWGEAARRHLQGDASSRRYERLVEVGRRAILMDSPARPDGPPVKDGKPYSQIAHLAETVNAFVGMANGLLAAGLSAPKILAADLAHGLLIAEDFGDEGVVAGVPPAPIPQRYATAVDALVALHTQPLLQTVTVEGPIFHYIPLYDADALDIELSLMLDWYLPHRGKPLADPDERLLFHSLWSQALRPTLDGQKTWVLRDYHSPNLLWLPGREGVRKIGIIDFQDAVYGPPAYDLASLLQDARVDVPQQLELELLARYVRGRRQVDPAFDAARFAQDYSVMAAQRATKILGIFARLDKRDGKPQYLRHLPRIWRYLGRALIHPSLELLARWYATRVPPPPAP